MPDADSKIISRWDECYQNYRELSVPPPDVEPRMLEITYPSPVSGELIREVIYEDPVKDAGVEGISEPRLLVPLRAILALKRLCERDFERFRATSSVLSDCRAAYYKELHYLREQLQAATRTETKVTAMLDDYVNNYEVYWFNPPSYVDVELQDFLKTCIRLTNKQLIEENYNLLCQAGGMHVERPGDETTILQDLIQKAGAGKLVKRIFSAVSSADDSYKQLPDLEATIVQLARSIEGEREEEVRVVQKPKPKEETAKHDPGMLEELELLRKKVRDGEMLRAKYLELQQRYDDLEATINSETNNARRPSELERLLAQERAQTAKLQSQLASLPAKPGDDSEISQLHDLLPQLAARIQECSMQFDNRMPRVNSSVAGGGSATRGVAMGENTRSAGATTGANGASLAATRGVSRGAAIGEDMRVAGSTTGANSASLAATGGVSGGAAIGENTRLAGATSGANGASLAATGGASGSSTAVDTRAIAGSPGASTISDSGGSPGASAGSPGVTFALSGTAGVGSSTAGAGSRSAGARKSFFARSNAGAGYTGAAVQLDDAVAMLENAMLNFKPSESAIEKELRERLRRAHEENAKLRDAATRLESDLQAQRVPRPTTPVPEESKSNAELERLKAEVQDLAFKLKSSEDAVRKLRVCNDELEKVVMRKDGKIYELKEEIKRLKRKVGEPVGDTDDEADSDDPDIPDWMKAYWRRVRNSVKPRWMLLNEDASCANLRLQHLMSSRIMVSPGSHSEALLAVEFLRRQVGADEAYSGRNPSAGAEPVQRTSLQQHVSATKAPGRISDSISPMVVYQETPVSSTGRSRPYEGRDYRILLAEEPERHGESPLVIQRQASPVPSAVRVDTNRGVVHTLNLELQTERNLDESTLMVRREQAVSALPEQITARRRTSRSPPLGDDELTVRRPQAELGGAPEESYLPSRLLVTRKLSHAVSTSESSPCGARQNQTLDASSALDAHAPGLSPSDALSGWTIGELVGTTSVAESSLSTAEPSAFLLAGPSVATSMGGAGDTQRGEEPDEGAAVTRARSGTRRPATAAPHKPSAAHQDAPSGALAAMSRSSSKSRGLGGQTSLSLGMPHDTWQRRPATAGGQQPLRHETPALGARPFSDQRCRSAGQLRPNWLKQQGVALPGAVWRPNTSSTLPITNAPVAGAGAQRAGRSNAGVIRRGREPRGASPARPGQATEAAVRILDAGMNNRPSPARSDAGDENLGKGPLLLPGVSPAMPPGRVRKSAPPPSWLLPP